MIFTGAFVSAYPVDSQYGLARGFEVYDDGFRNVDVEPAFVLQERPGKRTVARALEWIDKQGEAPWFAWVHVFEPHFPYAPPEPFASRYADDPYLGEVAATDALLEPLLDEPTLQISYAHDGERGQYLCALIRSRCLDSLPAYLDAGHRSVHGWYRGLGAAPVDFSDQAAAFANLNHLS